MTPSEKLNSLGFVASTEAKVVEPRNNEGNDIAGNLPAGKVKYLGYMADFKSGAFKFNALAFEAEGKAIIVSESALSRQICIGEKLESQILPASFEVGKEYTVTLKDGVKPVFKDKDMLLADAAWLAAEGKVYTSTDGVRYRGKGCKHHTITA